jgi:hypothetical protein
MKIFILLLGARGRPNLGDQVAYAIVQATGLDGRRTCAVIGRGPAFGWSVSQIFTSQVCLQVKRLYWGGKKQSGGPCTGLTSIADPGTFAIRATMQRAVSAHSARVGIESVFLLVIAHGWTHPEKYLE